MGDRVSLTDHDLLIRIDERVHAIDAQVSHLGKWIESHDKAHARTTKVLSAISAALGAIAGYLGSFLHR